MRRSKPERTSDRDVRITRSDVDAARRRWREVAPAQYRNLIDAEEAEDAADDADDED